MIRIKKFTFNPFEENTYVLYDKSGDCIIIDPGCFDKNEEQQLLQFIESNELSPSKLLNTHAHLDHVFGNKFVCDTFQPDHYAYKSEIDMWKLAHTSSKLYDLPYNESPRPNCIIAEEDILNLGDDNLEVIFVPGHSPDHIVLLNKKDKWLIGGDVLFKQSIGRTDLPGGDHKQLIDNIKKKLFCLDDDIIVYPGHGPETTIGEEKRSNPFF